jgi:DNA repair protein RecO (recombination protein O)
MTSYKLDAIILKRINLGEADRIITAFSDKEGKIRFVAKGSRRPKSKLAGSIEPFCLSNLLLSKGRSLDILNSAQIKANFLGLNPNLEELKTAGAIAEIIDKNIPDNFPSNSVFVLLVNSLSKIKENPKMVKVFFEINFLSLSGLLPETSLCIKCERKPEGDKIFFSKQGGGIICSDCKNYFPDSENIEINSVKAIKFAATNSVNNFLKLNLSETECNNLERLVSGLTRHSFGREIKSERI